MNEKIESRHIVSLSGGVASAVCAERVINRYGKAAVTLWFADTLWEDADLYRFLDDLESRWQMKIIRTAEGRNPLQVAEDRKLIPNQRRAPCSLVLKIEPFVDWLQDQEKPLTVHLGLDWSEEHRMVAPRKRYTEIDGVDVDFPLMWKPYERVTYFHAVKNWGIEPPRLYAMGFPHNNCGGRCVRQGHSEWKRLQFHFPERFKHVRDWELVQRDQGGPRADYAICRDQREGEVKPITLAQLEKQQFKLVNYPNDKEDLFGCFCDY